MKRWSKQTFTTGITAAAIFLWIMSLIARTLMPATMPAYTGLDAVVLLVVGYWFSSNAVHRNGDPK